MGGELPGRGSCSGAVTVLVGRGDRDDDWTETDWIFPLPSLGLEQAQGDIFC